MLTLRLDPVGSTAVHSSGTVVATCSGQRSLDLGIEVNDSASDETDDGGYSSSSNSSMSSSQKSSSPKQGQTLRTKSKTLDNSIKVWAL